MAGSLYLVSSGMDCRAQRAPVIQVSVRDSTVQYNHSKTKKELETLPVDTVSPYGAGVQTHIGGLMSGEVRISQNIRFIQETYPRAGKGCLYIDQINVKIHINPQIYIARDYKRGGCMYRAIMEHEKKHVAVDQKIVAKYSGLIKQALIAEVRAFPAALAGPYAASELDKAQGMFQGRIQGLVNDFTQSMSAERRAEQQKVDSLEEYERVQAQCPRGG